MSALGIAATLVVAVVLIIVAIKEAKLHAAPMVGPGVGSGSLGVLGYYTGYSFEGEAVGRSNLSSSGGGSSGGSSGGGSIVGGSVGGSRGGGGLAHPWDTTLGPDSVGALGLSFSDFMNSYTIAPVVPTLIADMHR